MEKTEFSPEERNKIGRRAGIVGIAVNILLFSVKLFAGIISASVSIMADAFNNLSDACSSIILMVGYILSAKPSDREHPYGHARFEYISSLIISLIVTFLGFELLKSSIESLISGSDNADFKPITIVIMVLSVAAKISLALFYRAKGNKISSQSLKASAVDSIGDVVSTSVVIAGIFLCPVFGPWVDGALGCLIAAYIMLMGVKLIKESSDTLLGQPPNPELVDDMVKKISSYDGVLGVHDLMVHNYGEGRIFASVHVEMDAYADALDSHDRIDNIENEFRDELGIELVIHYDPIDTKNEKLTHLKESVKSITEKLSEEYSTSISMHDFRGVFGPTHSNLIFDVVVTDTLPISEDDLCKRIKKEVRKLSKTYNAVIKIDKDYTSTLR